MLPSGILPATQQILTKYYPLVQYGPEMKDCGMSVSYPRDTSKGESKSLEAHRHHDIHAETCTQVFKTFLMTLKEARGPHGAEHV